MGNIYLNYNSTDYPVYCDQVSIAWKNNNDGKPDANNTEAYEVQTQSFDNPVYRLQNAQLTGTLTYSVLLNMAKNKYTGSNAITLKVNYGGTYLVASDVSTTSIPVVIDSFSVNINHKDSKEGTIPSYNITLRETK